jgi:murein DD-endopeptidase MepM/ murein hydrolase activator NlpD
VANVTKRVGALVAVLALTVGVAPLRAEAQSKAQRDRKIQSLKEQVAEASAEEAALLDQLDAVEDERQELDGKVAALDRQVAAAQRELDAASDALEARAAEVAAAQLELSLARRRLAAARAELVDRAVNAYMGEPTARGATRLVQLDTQRAIAAAHGYLEALLEAQHDEVEQFQARQRELVEFEAAVGAARDQAKAQRDVVAHRTAGVEAARADQAAARNAVLAQERRQEGLVENVRARKAEFAAQIAALQAESNSITAFLRSVQAGQGPPISGAGTFSSPIPGAAITSRFGPRTHPIFGDVRVHTGMDFRAATGTPVRAAGDGVIVWAGARGGYGNCVIIDHGHSLATLYGHLSSIGVGVGRRVSAGQIIGRAGSTGYSTGPHLHFEVRNRGVPVDPLGYL